MTALMQAQNQQLHIEATGSVTAVPNNPLARLMYYLGCINCVCDGKIPRQYTDYANYSRVSNEDCMKIIQLARALPPDEVPFFKQVEDAGEANNDFLKFSSLEETVTALGIQGEGATLLAFNKQVEKTQLLEVMIYEPVWARNNYFIPLLAIAQMLQQQQRPAITQGPTTYYTRKNKKSCSCAVL